MGRYLAQQYSGFNTITTDAAKLRQQNIHLDWLLGMWKLVLEI
jgi:hypothetical protein